MNPRTRPHQELDEAIAKVPGKLSHVDLVPMLGIADWEKGSATAGNRGYYLVGDGVLLNQVSRPQIRLQPGSVRARLAAARAGRSGSSSSNRRGGYLEADCPPPADSVKSLITRWGGARRRAARP